MDKNITATEIKKRFDDFNYKMNYKMDCDADRFLFPLIEKTQEIIGCLHKNLSEWKDGERHCLDCGGMAEFELTGDEDEYGYEKVDSENEQKR